MNFTKEYISEADCPEIQGLRINKKSKSGKLIIRCGDWFYNKDDGFKLAYEDYFTLEETYYIWLPLSYELDDEIVKICKEKNWTYYFIADNDTEYYAEVKQMYRVVYSKYNDNPLIAKIKLLKGLLNG